MGNDDNEVFLHACFVELMNDELNFCADSNRMLFRDVASDYGYQVLVFSEVFSSCGVIIIIFFFHGLFD